MGDPASPLETYGSLVARLVRRAIEENGAGDGRDGANAAGRDALLQAARASDRDALARFGEGFLRAYESAGPAAAGSEQPPAASPSVGEPAPARARQVDDGPAPRLTIQEYATVRAECMEESVHVGDVLARHGLDEASDRAEVAAWGHRFKRDPELFERYKALFQEMRRARASSHPPARAGATPGPAARPAPLSIHQYASLRAECVAAPPEELEQVRARYGLDETSDAAEVGRWMRKFDEEPTLFEQYKKLFQYFRQVNRRDPRPA